MSVLSALCRLWIDGLVRRLERAQQVINMHAIRAQPRWLGAQLAHEGGAVIGRRDDAVAGGGVLAVGGLLECVADEHSDTDVLGRRRVLHDEARTLVEDLQAEGTTLHDESEEALVRVLRAHDAWHGRTTKHDCVVVIANLPLAAVVEESLKSCTIMLGRVAASRPPLWSRSCFTMRITCSPTSASNGKCSAVAYILFERIVV